MASSDSGLSEGFVLLETTALLEIKKQRRRELKRLAQVINGRDGS